MQESQEIFIKPACYRSLFTSVGTASRDFYSFIYFILFYFEQYLFRGAQFCEAGLNGALMKRKKKQHKKTITDKKKWNNQV